MRNNDVFLTNFEESLRQLDILKNNIQKSAQDKANFNTELKKKLTEINEKLETLASKIEDLKKIVTNLEIKHKENEGLIEESNADLEQNLNETNALLQKELEDIKALQQNGQQNNENNRSIAEKESIVNELQEKITNLESEKNEYYQTLVDENTLLMAKIDAATNFINTITNDMNAILNGLQNAETEKEITEILERIENNLKNINNVLNEQTGGTSTRKRRKNKKQKGGFTYKINSKRKSIVSHTNTLKKTSKSSFKSTSKRNSR